MEAMIDLHVELDDGSTVILDNVGMTPNLCLERANKVGAMGVVALDARSVVYYPPSRIRKITFQERKIADGPASS